MSWPGREWRVGILRYLPTPSVPWLCDEPALWSCSIPLALGAQISEGSGSYQSFNVFALVPLAHSHPWKGSKSRSRCGTFGYGLMGIVGFGQSLDDRGVLAVGTVWRRLSGPLCCVISVQARGREGGKRKACVASLSKLSFPIWICGVFVGLGWVSQTWGCSREEPCALSGCGQGKTAPALGVIPDTRMCSTSHSPLCRVVCRAARGERM